MLIHLDSSAISGTLEGPEANRALDCLQDLLRAHHKGHHFLSIEPQDTERLARSPGVWNQLSRDHKNTLERIRATAPEIEGVRNQLSHHLVLGLGAEFDGRSHQSPNDRTILWASLLHFHGITTERAVLLCENMTDALFFREVAELLRASSRGSELVLAHDIRGAGGSQIAREAAPIAEEGKILLAIADSDQPCPGGAIGSTANDLSRVMRDRPAFQQHVVLPAREAENLLPLAAYKAMFEQAKGGRTPQLQKLKSLQEAGLTAAELAHADLKDGITLHQIQSKMTGKPEHATWFPLANRRGLAVCKRPEGSCSTEPEKKGKDCDCHVVEALGKKILDDVVEWLRGRTHPTAGVTAELLGLSNGSPLAQVAEQVIAWGCAYPRLET